MQKLSAPIIKQVVGIDVASQSFVASIGRISAEQQIQLAATAEFANTPVGISKLITWIEKHRLSQAPLWIVMEATGIYHERLAVCLHEHDYRVTIVLPNKIKHYALSLNLKSKTDRLDAMTITRYGLERELHAWQPPAPLLAQLKALVREHSDIQEMLTETRNRLHASERAAATPKRLLKRLRQQRDLFKKQLQQIEQELSELAKSDPDISESVECIDSIRGIGLLTAIGIVAETHNFALFDSAKQLVSYAGLDPKLRESGRWRGQTRISAKGNSHIRRILFMPALASIRFNNPLRSVYDRLVQTKSVKMVAVVAIMRKLLVLMFTLAKKRQRFDPNYHLATLTAAV